MNRIALFLALFVFLACKKEAAEKPEHMLTEDQMVDILYDITMLQAVRSFQPQVIDNNNVNPKKYIYLKHNIDSLTFAQNNIWYASDFDKYEKIQNRVAERIKKEKEDMVPKKDTAAVKKDSVKLKKSEIPGAEAKRDSFRKAALDRVKHRRN
ncbi:DUF4296 domain-containing protein [Flavobacterium sp. NRK1]|uniref:DUF4296 domain-containing protein n=1 Tax=Flavobacterium sp. NRK1 TaxID=2954929 RepID=UPI0020927143|nr:DUF4296 domain-containing protein [Flavobacterium sp. NRK1]MCO6148010.1 DUF4296 domain-containing protein [Flavobacterium sp. NRK1]